MKRILLALVIIVAALMPVVITRHAFAAYTNPFGDVCDGTLPGSSTTSQEGSGGSGGVPASGGDASSVCADKNNTDNPISGKNGIILKAVKIITYITGIASLIIVVLSGLKYITADGDSNSINSAKNTLLYAFIGIIVSLMSQAIIVYVINKL